MGFKQVVVSSCIIYVALYSDSYVGIELIKVTIHNRVVALLEVK